MMLLIPEDSLWKIKVKRKNWHSFLHEERTSLKRLAQQKWRWLNLISIKVRYSSVGGVSKILIEIYIICMKYVCFDSFLGRINQPCLKRYNKTETCKIVDISSQTPLLVFSRILWLTVCQFFGCLLTKRKLWIGTKDVTESKITWK